ncbi:putative membrane protein [Rubrobacter radiotolerans]|uniref:Putative membrane protein n=1 Tax=Rubrobacter radiotolerans TaxID=42256 RepID=A0A023X031_RUBRA|nr:hypothetical protein [Rubrobacter radiotolerans]AHY45683.1 putative membrane protein [Rubrobacter radiotolerans]MDX5893097.1 hypothetical protein [Rubrobacter radiotolerans]SMC03051.1 Uncharacterized membrane protein [Rubrobacter radiotolerans DSM 5868]
MPGAHRLRRYAPKALAALFLASGTAHFLRPEPFVRIVPRALPAPGALVYASGAAELVLAAGLLARRGWSGPASAALLVAVFPANVQMLLDLRERYGARSLPAALAWARLPLQLPLVWAALQVREK